MTEDDFKKAPGNNPGSHHSKSEDFDEGFEDTTEAIQLNFPFYEECQNKVREQVKEIGYVLAQSRQEAKKLGRTAAFIRDSAPEIDWKLNSIEDVVNAAFQRNREISREIVDQRADNIFLKAENERFQQALVRAAEELEKERCEKALFEDFYRAYEEEQAEAHRNDTSALSLKRLPKY